MITRPCPSAGEFTRDAGAFLTNLRDNPPLIQCITNSVVTGFTANVLLAVGAAPAMVDIVGEAGFFAPIAGGVLVNLGTVTPEQREASLEAASAADDASTPWVLDPVAIGALPIRTALAADLLEHNPTAIRGNASEIIALAGSGAGGRGPESADSPDAAGEAAIGLAQKLGTVVAVSGEEDLITDGVTVVRVANGDALLTKVTGGGCALGATIAAVLASRGDAGVLTAVVAAHVIYEIAAEHAARATEGPGSFAVGLLDALAGITPDDVIGGARIRTYAADSAQSTDANLVAAS